MSDQEGVPRVIQDPRFEAGQTLIQQGMAQEGAIEIFSTLLEDVRNKHGESSIETAPAYYEYGNSLLRAAANTPQEEEEDNDETRTPKQEDRRVMAAAAAEQRLLGIKKEETDEKKPAATTTASSIATSTTTTTASEAEVASSLTDSATKEQAPQPENEPRNVVTSLEDETKNDDDDDDDLPLALEMMENAYAILLEYKESKEAAAKPYEVWVQAQVPRVLNGIGDCLAAMDRHADAADSYSRALQFRQEQLEVFGKEDNTLEHLQAHRRVCEAAVLVAEELLACPSNEDVVTTEANSLIVKATERIEYARGYYDNARDALQETVFTMGKIAAAGNIDLGKEKEDVCFIATLVMGVGTSLAALDEEQADNATTAEDGNSKLPASKKRKT